MPKLLKYILTLFILMPALSPAQLNSDYKLIKRKKIKTVYAYNLTKNFADSLRYDTTWASYSYNKRGKIVSISKGDRADFESYKQYNEDGYITSILSRDWETTGITKTDTTGYYFAAFDSANNCTISYSFGYDSRHIPGSLYLRALKKDSIIILPTIYADKYFSLYKNADYVYEDYNIINSSGDLIAVINDTIFYYDLHTWDELKIRRFVVTETTDSGYVARCFYQKNDSVFYDGVYSCISKEQYGLTYITTQYKFISDDKGGRIPYVSLHPKYETLTTGTFVKQSSTYLSLPSNFNDFLNEYIDQNGRLIKHIDLLYQTLPPFTKEFQEENSLKALRAQYKYVVIIERY